jgi:hypothetical protein
MHVQVAADDLDHTHACLWSEQASPLHRVGPWPHSGVGLVDPSGSQRRATDCWCGGAVRAEDDRCGQGRGCDDHVPRRARRPLRPDVPAAGLSVRHLPRPSRPGRGRVAEPGKPAAATDRERQPPRRLGPPHRLERRARNRHLPVRIAAPLGRGRRCVRAGLWAERSNRLAVPETSRRLASPLGVAPWQRGRRRGGRAVSAMAHGVWTAPAAVAGCRGHRPLRRPQPRRLCAGGCSTTKAGPERRARGPRRR